MASAFEQMEPAGVLAELTSSDHGLSATQAALRLRTIGPNRLTAVASTSLWKLAGRQFTSLFALLLIGSSVLDYFLDAKRDAVVLFAIVAVNAVIGFLQEYKAERIIQSLRKLLAPTARVLRDGKAKQLSAELLVPGDIVVLEEGDSIPADLRLLEEHELHTNDFSLTGEADPKNKFTHALSEHVPLPQRDNEAFLGTTVARGNGRGVVIATGMQTEIGRIARLSQQTHDDPSPLQLEIDLLARRLTVVTVIIAAGLFLLAVRLLRPFDAFVLAIGVAAACVPEGLPAQVSVALSLGMKRLAKRAALVKKLSAVETLGSTSVICTDKTGTLTAGQMTILRFWSADATYDVSGTGYEPEGQLKPAGEPLDTTRLARLLRIGPLSSTADVRPPDEEHLAWYCLGDPTEGALLTLARKGGLDPSVLRSEEKEERQFPFDSVRKRMSSIRQSDAGLVLYLKGAPDAVVEKSTRLETEAGIVVLDPRLRERLSAQITACSAEGYRVLALAYRPLTEVPKDIQAAEQDLVLAGFVAMSDPPREDVAEALAATRTAGIRTFILTGDSAVTATAIARKVGMVAVGEEPTIVEGGTLLAMDDSALQGILLKPTAIFCRVSPEDKLRIVELVKRHGDVVAVTGDGVNDAPALKSAAIGVAMGKTGTDVAKNAAEIILLDDSFATLVAAVREGRTIFRNLRKTVLSSLTSNGGELFATLFGFSIMAVGMPQPLLAVQILAIDLLAEMAPLTLLTLDPAPLSIMHEPPRPRGTHLVSFKDLAQIAGWGALMGAISVVNFVIYIHMQTGVFTGLNPSLNVVIGATTVTYLTIVFCQYANILSRRWDESVFSLQTLWNPSVLISMAVTLLSIYILTISPAGAFLHFAPVGWQGWSLAFAGGGFYLACWELLKQRRRARRLVD